MNSKIVPLGQPSVWLSFTVAVSDLMSGHVLETKSPKSCLITVTSFRKLYPDLSESAAFNGYL